jgi:carotenoid cleavage dioxygenase
MNTPFLASSMAPVKQEQTITALRVTGQIPADLDGRYLRNGPNPAHEIDPDTYNWFTGDGMVHGIRLRNGNAEWYRNRWVRPVHGSAPMNGIGANTNVIGHAGRILALVEGGVGCSELSGDLDTVGPCDFDGTLPGGYTAHPKRDPDTGELHAVSYYFGNGNKVQYSVIDAAGKARRTVDIEVTGSPMMHDLSITEKYVIFYDLPVTFDARQAVEVAVPRPLRAPARLVLSALVGRVRIPGPMLPGGARQVSAGLFPYRWNPRYPARIGVMPREGDNDDMRWFDIEPCYVFHPLNAHDDGNTIVLDVVRHDKVFDRDLRAPFESTPVLTRWTVDLGDGKVRSELLDDREQEFPRVDERRTGKKTRYGYAAALKNGGAALLRHDLERATTQARSFGVGTEPGEFVFVPRHADAAEDDGVLMGFVYDSTSATTNLVLADAATLDTVATIHLPVRVPTGFHGNWIPSSG